jgi:hypothetical protein
VFHRFVGMWVFRRAYRLLTVEDGRPLRQRLTREAKRVVIGAALLLVLAVGAAVALIVLVVLLLS